MPFARHRAAAARDRSPHPRAPVHGRVLGRDARCRRARRAGPTFYVRSPRAAAHVLRAPGQLGLGRAYVSGEIEVDDMDAVIELLDGWQPPPLEGADKRALLLGAVRAAGPDPAPGAGPQSELRPSGRRHSKERDARAVRHHYDVSNEFFSLFLDDSMTYSCAIFSRGAETLEEAQEEKLEMVARKLGAEGGRPGARRRLRLGQLPALGGDPARRQRRRHHPLPPQAEKARAAGRGGRRRRPGRDPRSWTTATWPASASTRSPASAWSSTSARPRSTSTPRTLAGLLEPGGRLLNHGIARLRHTDPDAGPFSERYVFPDATPLHLSRVLLALERAGFVTRHVEEFGADYAETLRHWARRLDENLDEAVRLGRATSGSASGASICAPPATASRSASPRSTRPAARWR